MSNMLIALLGALVATIVAIASALVFVIRSSKDAGKREGNIDAALDELKSLRKEIEMVRQNDMEIKILKEAFSQHRSDFKELKRHGSNPNWGEPGDDT